MNWEIGFVSWIYFIKTRTRHGYFNNFKVLIAFVFNKVSTWSIGFNKWERIITGTPTSERLLNWEFWLWYRYCECIVKVNRETSFIRTHVKSWNMKNQRLWRKWIFLLLCSHASVQCSKTLTYMFANKFLGLYSGVNGEILKAPTKLRHPCTKDPQNDHDLEMTLAFVKNEKYFF